LTAWNRARNSLLKIRALEQHARHSLGGLLSFRYESHILYYKKHASDIVIVRVLHQHMDPVKHL
jgi:plasmid stabilization system protein ParE